jgi:hypothetical protein
MASISRRVGTLTAAAALFGVLLPAAAVSQTTVTRAPLLAEAPGSPSAFVLGRSAEWASGSHAAVFHNVGALRSTGGAAIWAHSFGGHATVLGITTGRALLGGAFAVGLRQVSHRGAGAGLGSLPTDEGDFLSEGPIGLNAVEATVGYSRSAPFGLRIGVGGKLLEQTVDGARVSRAALDLGATRRLGPATLGVSARNIGEDMDFGDLAAPLPLEFGVGAAVPRQAVGPLDIGGAVNLVYREDEEYVPSGGVEVAYWPIQGRTFIGRIGYAGSPSGPAQSIVLGGGIELDAWAVNYGWRPYEDLRDGHQFGITWGG